MDRETILNKLEFNLILELKRKDITKEDKSFIINDYLKSSRLSIRALSKELNVPVTTLFYWLHPEKKSAPKSENMAPTSLKLEDEIIFILNTLKKYKDRLDQKRFIIDDKLRARIEEIKDLAFLVYMKTRKVKTN